MLGWADQQRLAAMCGPDARWDERRCIHEWFQAQAAARPEQTAITFRGSTLSYRSLNEQANRLAHRLQALGVGPEVPVAIYLERGFDFVVALLATLKAGGAYIPLDGSYPWPRVVAIMADAASPVIVSRTALLGEGLPNGATAVLVDGDLAQTAPCAHGNPECTARGDNTAFILFTSGSTGQPKGVRVMHRNLVNYGLLWERECTLTSSIAAVCQTSFTSFAVFQGDWIRALCFGKRLVLCAPDELESPAALYALMRRETVDFAECVPALLRSLVQHLQATGQKLDFLRILVIGADRWYLREHLQARHCLGAQTRFIHVYGLSETTLDSTRFEHTDLALNPDQPTPIGRPFTNVQAYVLDEALRPVPPDTEGELCIGGAGVAAGYLNLPELTADRFVPDPFSDRAGARLFRTGDMARWLPDGQLAFVGRRDQQVKLQGFRVELGEVEAVLESHPAVATAVVQGFEMRPGVTILVAYCVARDASATALALRAHAASRLPAFMVPSRWTLLPVLPLTPSGKIDRRALPTPDTRRPALATRFVAPDQGIQADLAQAWQLVLGLDQVGVDDNFFDLGGNSLLMLQLQGVLRAQWRYDLPKVRLYEYPTIRALARLLSAGDSAEAMPAQPAERAELRRERLMLRAATAGRRPR